MFPFPSVSSEHHVVQKLEHSPPDICGCILPRVLIVIHSATRILKSSIIKPIPGKHSRSHHCPPTSRPWQTNVLTLTQPHIQNSSSPTALALRKRCHTSDTSVSAEAQRGPQSCWQWLLRCRKERESHGLDVQGFSRVTQTKTNC